MFYSTMGHRRNKSSGGGPHYSSAIVESPTAASSHHFPSPQSSTQPHTPSPLSYAHYETIPDQPTHSQVIDSTTSAQPLLAHDYAQSPSSSLPDNEPLTIPPESINDNYLSSLTRPSPQRSTSAPNTHDLLPSVMQDDKPIFEVLDANLSETAEIMAQALRTHIDGILKAQEEIGAMHLALEHIGMGQKIWSQQSTPAVQASPSLEDKTQSPDKKQSSNGDDEDALSKREKGVEEIMNRVCPIHIDLNIARRLIRKTTDISCLRNPRNSLPQFQDPRPPKNTLTYHITKDRQ
jgi:hypothetical protein